MKTQTVHLFKWQGGPNWGGGGHYYPCRKLCYTTLISHYKPHVSQSSLAWIYSKDSTNDAYLATNINLSHLGLFAFDYVIIVLALHTTLCYVTADLSPTLRRRRRQRQRQRQCMLQHGVLAIFFFKPDKTVALPSRRAVRCNSLYGYPVWKTHSRATIEIHFDIWLPYTGIFRLKHFLARLYNWPSEFKTGQPTQQQEGSLQKV
jgi:hypothetical protein